MTFVHTLNPFNKNAQGEVKSHDEVMADIAQKVSVWKKKPEYCIACIIENTDPIRREP
jgi:hypothetical protein